MNTTTNYSNRQIDIELLQTIVHPTGDTKMSISISQPTARVVSGIQKLIQRYACLFLSLQDSKFDPELGTDFMRLVAQGMVRTKENLATAFAFANADVMEILLKDDVDPKYGVQPEDERIANVALIDYKIDVATATLSLTLLITTQGGDSIEFILPTSAPKV
jgi:hypothetical protein